MKLNGIDFDTYFKHYPDEAGFFGKYGGSYMSPELQKAMDEIIQLAREKYGGRLLLKPENRDCNPSIFYHKCGLLSTTEKGTKEIIDFIKFGKLSFFI